MDETQIKQIIERQPLHGTALLDPRCKILLLVCIGFVSYFLAGEVVSLALMLVYGLFIALGNGGKWAAKMIITYIVVAYLNALLRYVQVPVLSVIMSVFGVTVLKLMQAKKTNPEKTKNPEMLTLDSTYRIGNRSFIVEPVFKEESSQTLGEVLLRLMKSESEKL